ncbi:hypothetical protein M378DRAFT_1046738, partial [Amanita muscaria Koide BX008]
MGDKDYNISGLFHRASNVTASDSTFTEVHGNYNQNIHNYTTGPPVEAVELYPYENLNQIFTGCDSYLKALKGYFCADSAIMSLTWKSFLLYGKEGIGKTQVCLKFLEDVKDNFSMVFWIDASTEDSILSSLQDIAGALGFQDCRVIGSWCLTMLKWEIRC